ncbi:MAG TPA: DinB family protein [Sphingobacteriaceae bacterium]|nr:DinB family protein [Sphingobacteriaceae bacterium]
MNTSFLKEYFEYNAQVNEKLAEFFVENPGLLGGEAHRLFSHIVGAHHIWNHRIREIKPGLGVWELVSIEKLREVEIANLKDSLQILAERDLASPVSYQNSKGLAFESKISDILFHIINHSTYHRGQIARVVRENGFEPLVTDYIFMKR